MMMGDYLRDFNISFFLFRKDLRKKMNIFIIPGITSVTVLPSARMIEHVYRLLKCIQPWGRGKSREFPSVPTKKN